MSRFMVTILTVGLFHLFAGVVPAAEHQEVVEHTDGIRISNDVPDCLQFRIVREHGPADSFFRDLCKLAGEQVDRCGHFEFQVRNTCSKPACLKVAGSQGMGRLLSAAMIVPNGDKMEIPIRRLPTDKAPITIKRGSESCP